MEKQSEESLLQSPWLLYLDYHEKEQVFRSVSPPHRAYRHRVPILWENVIWNYTFGWILLSLGHSRFALFDPNTRHTIHLPVLLSKPNRKIGEGILWLPPQNPRSKVVLFDEGRKTIMYCYVQKKQWIEVSYKRQAMKLVDKIINNDNVCFFRPVICNGKLYAFLLNPFILVEIQISDQNCLEIKSLRCKVPSTYSHASRRQWWLAESEGELFVIDIAYGGVDCTETIDMGVFKLDISSSKTQWRKVKGSEIKDRAFFLSKQNHPISCKTTGQKFEGGRVYLIGGEYESLCSFDVEDGSITMSLPSKSFYSVLWVMMPHLRMEKGNANSRLKGINEGRRKTKKRSGFSESLDSKEECKFVNFCDLPHDVMGEVAKKLTPLGYMNFRTTCKTCCQVAPSIKLRESWFVHEEAHSLPPFLMFSKSGHTMHHFIDPQFGNVFSITPNESIVGAKIRYSKAGWLLMTNLEEESFFFYNPFTKEAIELPKDPIATRCNSLCFTDIPSSPDCIVMGVDFTGFRYFYTREQEWHYVNSEDFNEIFPDDLSIHTTFLFFKGAFYLLGTEGSLSQVILDEELIIYNGLHCPCEDFCQNFLLEWDGKLVSVFINSKWTTIQVFTLNEDMMVWEEVLSLGKYSLFLSRFSAFSVATAIPEMENKIYLSKIYGEVDVIFYCFEDKWFGHIKSDKRTKSFCGTKEYLSSCWIEPNWKESVERAYD